MTRRLARHPSRVVEVPAKAEARNGAQASTKSVSTSRISSTPSPPISQRPPKSSPPRSRKDTPTEELIVDADSYTELNSTELETASVAAALTDKPSNKPAKRVPSVPPAPPPEATQAHQVHLKSEAEIAAPEITETEVEVDATTELSPEDLQVEGSGAPEAPAERERVEPDVSEASFSLEVATDDGTNEPATAELARPDFSATRVEPLPQHDEDEVTRVAVEDSVQPLSAEDVEVQTRPKIRLPDGSSLPTSSPPAAYAADGGSREASGGGGHSNGFGNGTGKGKLGPVGLRTSPLPPPPPAPAGRGSSPAPDGATAASINATGSTPPAARNSSTPPTGEGIVRARPPSGAGRDSDLPTRPRIALTPDMVMAAGRITSQEVVPYPTDSVAAARDRLRSYPPMLTGDEAPAVIVTRAQLISDRPPPSDATRPSRRPRPEADDFETLDLDDTESDSEGGDILRLAKGSRAENVNKEIAALGGSSSLSGETGVRVSRTPPPPPAHAPTKQRITVTTGVPASVQRAERADRPAPPPPPPPTAAAKKAPTTGPKTRATKKRAWWEVLFSDDYVRTLPKASPVAVAKQVGFMEASLGLKRGDAVLDVGCGLGQHALEFAKRGYLVVALDLALSMITRAAEEAQQRGLRINFLHKDIRDIGFEGTFDAIVCVGTTFGFFDDEQNRGVITRLAHALKPGGRLLLEVVNRDFVIGSQPNLVWFEGDGCVVMEESDFNFYSSRLTVKRTMMRDDGRQSDIEYNIRLYSVHELGQMLKQAGFSIKEVSGQEATRGLFFGAQSTRIIILAERRPRSRSKDDNATPSNDAT